MYAVDYQPTINGLPYDPEPVGGSVTSLRLYGNPARTGSIIADVTEHTRLDSGAYRFVITGVPDGRYWMTVTWVPAFGDPPVVDNAGYVDFPIRADLIVSAEDVATPLALPLPLDDATRHLLHDAIRDGQAAVIGAIGPIIPQTMVIAAAYPYGSGDLTDPDTWFNDPHRVRILTATPNVPADGTYRVLYTRGINGRDEEPIRRYVRAHAAAWFARTRSGESVIGRRVTSASTEGQSASYASGVEGSPVGMDPAAPTLDALIARYVHSSPRVFQRRDHLDPFRPSIWHP